MPVDPYAFVESWSLAVGTEDASCSGFPTFPQSSGTETHEQFEQQRQLVQHYMYCDQHPWLDPSGKRRLFRWLLQTLAADRHNFNKTFGEAWAGQLENVLKRSVLVRAEWAVETLLRHINNAEQEARSQSVDHELEAKLQQCTDELNELKCNRDHDVPLGWVWRPTSDNVGVYVNPTTRVAQRENPRDEAKREAAEDRARTQAAIEFLKKRVMEKNEALKAAAAERERLEQKIVALEARPMAEHTDTGPKGDNFLVCPEPSCRTLLWCERPGGHGEFDVVDSVACSKCEIKTYYCIPCAERLGWQLLRKSALCPACAVGA